MPPRLIRRRPLAERLKAYLDPVDFLLWLSEEMDSSDWDKWQRDWASTIGLSINVIFLVARANSGHYSDSIDEVFGDGPSYSSWVRWFNTFLVHLFSIFSFVNAFYAFYRSRRYRLFENPIETIPSTPSAQRVRVDSSPVSSSPLRFLSSMISSEKLEDRIHPDPTKDVWEIAVWDPSPLPLQIFCMFSPGHVLLYWLLLPISAADPRPSATVITVLLLTALMSAQLLVLRSSFSQQSKDSTIIQREVLNEYDTKFVHPRSQPLMRDVGIQVTSQESFTHGQPNVEDLNSAVSTYPPTIVINRTFRTRPNPNYVKLLDPDGSAARQTPSKNTGSDPSPAIQTPAFQRDMSSPLRQPTAIKQPQYRSSTAGDGGSLGVYSHANSPIKKSASTMLSGSRIPRERLSGLPRSEATRHSSNPLSPLANEGRFGHYKDAQAKRSSGRF